MGGRLPVLSWFDGTCMRVGGFVVFGGIGCFDGSLMTLFWVSVGWDLDCLI